ncbi:unnamed protein product, partial [Linum tenue]
ETENLGERRRWRAKKKELRDSVAALNEALASDPSNSELRSVREELVRLIKDAEDGLLHLKRARLLKELDVAERIDIDAITDGGVESLEEEEDSDDGSSARLDPEAISLFQYALASEEEDSDDTSAEQSESSDYEQEESAEGLGFLGSTNQQRGIQTETAIFAKWENHTRGIASKMMANMGYCEGLGLEASGQGMANPMPVKVLPDKQSLEHVLESQKREEAGNGKQAKKRSRGGKRKRDKKFAAPVRAAKSAKELRKMKKLVQICIVSSRTN